LVSKFEKSANTVSAPKNIVLENFSSGISKNSKFFKKVDKIA
jgi:hypothetical protein